jgi:hypothetical protein
LVEQIKLRGGSEVVVGEGRARGLISRGWLASEIAGLIDGWSLSEHNPNSADYPYSDYHRQPDPTRSILRSNDPRNDPYLVAGYLRWWLANPGDSPPPTFNVGVTYGPLANNTTPFSFRLLNRAITLDGLLQGGWGGEDKIMDNPASELIDAAGDRMHGADGLLLLHIVHSEALGRGRGGHTRPIHTISFGVVVPAGGPSFSIVVNYDRR